MMNLNELTQVTFSITKKCNLSCLWCYESASKHNREMPISEIKVIIDQLSNLPNLEKLVLTGGEPFIHKDIDGIIQYCFDKNIKHVHITTNATIALDKILKKYIGKNISLSVSIDGLNKIHDNIRGTGSFEKSIDNIKKAKDMGFDVSVTTTVSKNNIDDVSDMALFLAKVEISQLKFQRMRLLGEGKDKSDLILNKQDNKELTYKILQLKKALSENIGVGYKDPFLNTIDEKYLCNIGERIDSHICGGCRCGMSYLFITVDGDVYPCPFLKISLGNVSNKKIDEIWLNSKLLRAFRIKENYTKCKSCKFWGVCRGCRAEAFIHTKDVFGEDPGCWMN